MEGLTYEQLFDALRREKSRDDLQKLDPGFYSAVRMFLQDKRELMLQANAQGFGGLGAQRAGIEYQNIKRIVRELYERRERKILTLALHKMRTESAIVDTSTLLPEEHVLFATLIDSLTQTRDQIFTAMGVDGMVPVRSSDSETSFERHKPSHSSSASMTDAPPLQYSKNTASSDDSEDDSSDDSSYGSDGSESYPAQGNADGNYDDSDDESEAAVITAPPGMTRVEIVAPVPKVMGGDGKVYGPCNAGEIVFLPQDIAGVLLKKGRAKAA